jgi:hypothetical protein
MAGGRESFCSADELAEHAGATLHHALGGKPAGRCEWRRFCFLIKGVESGEFLAGIKAATDSTDQLYLGLKSHRLRFAFDAIIP